MSYIELAENSINQIINIQKSTNSKKLEQSYLQITEILIDFLESLISYLNVKFKDNYELVLFIVNKFNISKYQADNLISIIKSYKLIKTNEKIVPNLEYLNFLVISSIKIIELLSNYKLSYEHNVFLNNLKVYFRTAKINEENNVSILNLIVIEKYNNENKFILRCKNLFDDELLVELKDLWKNSFKIIFEGISINLLNIKEIEKSQNYFVADQNSYLIIEPDFLIDVTEIANSIGDNKYKHNFVKRFIKNSEISIHLLIGSLTNYIFDLLIQNINIDFESCYENAVKSKILEFYYFYKDNKNIEKLLKTKLKEYYKNLKKVIQSLDKGEITTEPTFISPLYGIQGRLDLLIEDNENKYLNVLELKSGKVTKFNTSFKLLNRTYIIDLWPEHIFQLTGYDLLMNYVFEDYKINNSIIYVQSNDHPIKNVNITEEFKRFFIYYRNWIASLDFRIKNNELKILEKLNIKNINEFFDYNSFAAQDIIYFINFYNNSSKLIKEWFNQMIVFIAKELYLSKNGDPNKNYIAFSNLWKSDINNKIEDKIIITNLKFNYTKSNFEQMHLHFDIPTNQHFSFRQGDIIIIYPENRIFEETTKNVIYKGYILELKKDFIVISLRNKKINKLVFVTKEYWTLELDYQDHLIKNLYHSIFELLSTNKEKANLLLGLQEQKIDNKIFKSKFRLNKKQKEIFNKAINAESFFLIQGPPGTGKTSFMLCSLVLYYLENTDSIILVSAYTNRALDEIYESIIKYVDSKYILKIGSKTDSNTDEITLSKLFEYSNKENLINKVKNSRIIISTISSLLTNNIIFKIKNFEIAIIDEASQILEPQIIGILAKCKKFILIGDENQLPAVCLQDEYETRIDNTELNNLEFYNLTQSYFERMIRLSKKLNRAKNFGSLEEQARMHIEIQEFPNENFYSGILKPIKEKQFEKQKFFNKLSSDKLEQFIANYRVVFINCPIDLENKVNNYEVKICLKIINLINEKYKIKSNKNLGVISPFKLQCNKIRQYLPHNLLELITIDTVERYQGSQRDFIIISMAVNSFILLEKAISMNIDNTVDRKLNVALTRAKEYLIMLGNREILTKNLIYEKFINYCISKNSYEEYQNLI